MPRSSGSRASGRFRCLYGAPPTASFIAASHGASRATIRAGVSPKATRPRPGRRLRTSTLSKVRKTCVGALAHIDSKGEAGVYVLCDAHPFLDDPIVRRMLREVALHHADVERTLVLLSPQIELPTGTEALGVAADGGGA